MHTYPCVGDCRLCWVCGQRLGRLPSHRLPCLDPIFDMPMLMQDFIYIYMYIQRSHLCINGRSIDRSFVVPEHTVSTVHVSAEETEEQSVFKSLSGYVSSCDSIGATMRFPFIGKNRPNIGLNSLRKWIHFDGMIGNAS